MLDFQAPPPSCTKTTMSRKRTRSRSEDNLYGTNRVQPAGATMSFCGPAVFSDDPLALKRLEECDYGVRITHDMAKKGRAPRAIRVYADGAFDLFHQGHARVLLQAKNAYPNIYLIVGVCSDAQLHKMKGRTVLDEEERYSSVAHCRYVDEVVRDAPWTISDAFMKKHKIDFVAHDDIPYPMGDCEDIYAPIKQRGMFITTERTDGISTSDIVARIVRDYDVYARRNLARGYSAKELNLSYLREKKLRIQNKMETLKDKSKSLFDSIGERKDDMMSKWEEKSKEVIDGFLLMFGRNRNKVTKMIRSSSRRLLRAITPPGTPLGSSSDDSDSNSDEEPYRKIRRLT